MDPRRTARWLADAALAGPLTADAVAERVIATLGRRLPRSHRAGVVRAARVIEALGPEVTVEVARAVFADVARRARVVAPPLDPPDARPAWGLPPIATVGELAARWDVDADALVWLADVDGRTAHQAPPRRHHHHRWVPKRGGVGHRLLEIPKPRLRDVQRRLLDDLLTPIPVNPAAHGFARGRSLLGHVTPHAGRALVVTLDLEAWFSHVTDRRARGVLRRAGVPWALARVLAGLATTTTPADVLATRPGAHPGGARHVREDQLLRQPHLAQGAPSSPALANAVAWGLDTRLAGLAARFGATYTRYADDLAFSGDAAFARDAARLVDRVATVVRDEGFRVNARKVRVMPQGIAQRICGVVVNAHPAVSRADRDRLEATLVHASRHGLDRLHAEGHDLAWLRGRVAWVTQVHPTHGARLAALLHRIDDRRLESTRVKPDPT